MRDRKTCSHAVLQSGIYEIRHINSGRVYVGSARCIPCRWRLHLFYLKKGKHHSSYLQRSWEKYGEDAFAFAVLEACTPEQLIEREQHWIDSTGCIDRAKGFNRAPRAGSQLGFKHSEESIQKMRLRKMSEEDKERLRQINTGRKQSEATVQQRMKNTSIRKLTDEQIREIQQKYEDSHHTITQTQLAREYSVDNKTISCVVRRKGRTYQTDVPISNLPTRTGNRQPRQHSAETRAKMSASRQGHATSEETRKKISEAQKGKPRPRGRHLTEEQKQRISEANKGRTFTPEHRQHLSAANKGKPGPMKGKTLTPEQKQRMSEAHKGKPSPRKGKTLTEEQKQKIREGRKKRLEED